MDQGPPQVQGTGYDLCFLPLLDGTSVQCGRLNSFPNDSPVPALAAMLHCRLASAPAL